MSGLISGRDSLEAIDRSANLSTDDFLLKLLAAARLGQDAIKNVLRIQRSPYISELAALADLRKQEGTLARLLVEAASLHTKANLKVIDLAASQISTLVEQPIGKPSPLLRRPSRNLPWVPRTRSRFTSPSSETGSALLADGKARDRLVARAARMQTTPE